MSGHDRHHHRHQRERAWDPPKFLQRWFGVYTVLAGVLALAWLLLRSGPKPSRFAYPCQQAAFSTAAGVFGAALVGGAVAIRRRLSARWLTPIGIILGCVCLFGAVGVWSYQNSTAAYEGPLMDPSGDYRAQVFHESNCPEDLMGDRFICVEDLIESMGARGLKFHRSDTTSLTAGPEGIIASDDIVVIKINYQWPERGGSNTDVLRGLLHRLFEHPDGFTGEVVVAENSQFNSIDGFDRSQNNAQDHHQSPADVVNGYRAMGHRISTYDWTSVRYSSVEEYSAGNYTDGYVVYPYDSALNGRISYPKFRSDFGTYISLRDGIWNGVNAYDRESLKFINLPVLKSHHATYGATAAVKHYMGVVTGELSTNSHSSIHYGVMGALMGEIQVADLNILDAIWINANPYDGPWTTYGAATRVDQLVASLDPVALDLWAVKNILIPTFIAEGYSPPWPYPSADPDTPSSKFRQYLDNSMMYLLAAGYDSTNDIDQIDAHLQGPPGEVSDPTGGGAPFEIEKLDEGGYRLTWSPPFRGGRAMEYVLYRTALDGGPLDPECEAILTSLGTSFVVDDLPDDFGFIVVARNAAGDGAFGKNHLGHDRPSPAEGNVCP